MITRFTYLFIALTSLTFLNQTRFKKEDLLGQSKLNFYDESIRLLPEAGKAFVAMREAALKEGIKIEIVSAYRSYERQKFIWNRKFYSNAEKGINPKENINKIIEYSTLPGTSRHHWGTDIDIIDGKKPKEGDLLLEEKFHGNGPYVKLREWMEKNAIRFGFYLPYTDSRKREGFNYEPWHYSFAPLSIPMLEEYLKLDLINLLTPNDLSGKSCIDKKFIESYINENVLGINPKLKDFKNSAEF
ncbi:D-alanyl-D-alanine carboxypeptidase [Bacteroidetes bacterium SCGC AAA795-G10]|nr:D-alanyl-D-alanine carboxypeptidase [Bacteroidetes bacterium SCGC AAA795-G10]